ncbi:YybH family protein [Geodermatophilus ruber]|uniref:DUF4440 domain-containing protein n=1 Tax=Geodermatophilus ruber TaxID=504800 RepID=A0A1I4H6V6_9ACTN|nr:SgcJ/EcaC family oxidoreductase [Geodermatophilus ruber]SFL37136.1 conserved hypothetical protein [Geodermatophilus ruber]
MARSDVDALNATFLQGVEKGDAALMATVYAPDARLLPPGSDRVTGVAAIEEFWRGVLGMGVTGGLLETVQLDEWDDVAVEEGRYELRVGEQVADIGKYVVVHQRQADGGWKWGLDIWNSSRPPHAG